MILEKIVSYKKEELEHYQRQVPFAELKARVKDMEPALSLEQALRNPPASFAIIAEIKRQSPSKGIIRQDFRPVEHAQDYASHGAAALSVLTDEHFFGGHLDYLKNIRPLVKIPLLRKDFIWDPYQVFAAREAGADAILLIAAMLEKNQMEDLYGLAQELSLSVLVEVHNLQELQQVLPIQPSIIGVNNRDLKTFKVDLATSEKLFPLMSPEILKVAESGIENHTHLEQLSSVGAQAFLIGESFMKAKKPGEALANLIDL